MYVYHCCYHYICRHADVNYRPKFVEVIKILNQPELKLLRWSQEDLQSYDEQATTLGTPLSCGRYLFTELQQAYKEETLVPYL